MVESIEPEPAIVITERNHAAPDDLLLQSGLACDNYDENCETIWEWNLYDTVGICYQNIVPERDSEGNESVPLNEEATLEL